jgi:hypothetical protein
MARTPPAPPQLLLSDSDDNTTTDSVNTPDLNAINTSFQENISFAPVEQDLETNNINACKYMTAEDFNISFHPNTTSTRAKYFSFNSFKKFSKDKNFE